MNHLATALLPGSRGRTPPWRTLVRSLRAAGLAALAAAGREAFPLDQGFPIHDLGHFGGNSAQALDVNDHGDVVGGAADANGDYRPFVVSRETFTWFRDQDGDGRNDLMLDLGTLGGADGTAYAISDLGHIVGSAKDADGVNRAFLFEGNRMTDLGDAPGELSTAYDVNSAGVVVGEAGQVLGSSGGRPFAWDGTRTLMASRGVAFAVDESGRAAGRVNDFAYEGFVVHPAGGAYFRDSTPQDGANDLLTNLGEGEVRGMNDRGLLVGVHDQRPAVWQGIWRELSTLPNLPLGYANAVNDLGQVVGHDFTSNRTAAFLYLPEADYGLEAGIYELTKLLRPGSGWALEYATGINDEGIVVGWGTHLGKTAAFVLELGGSVLCDPPLPDVPANHAFSAEANDPVNTFTGDFVMRLPPDLDLGGPAGLAFTRYHCSGLAARGVRGSLGEGWLHDFEATLVADGATAQAVLPRGRTASFARTGSAWVLAGRRDVPFQLLDSGSGHVLLDPRDDRIWTFDAQGLPASVEDALGARITLTRAGGRLDRAEDGLGRSLAFDWGPDGLLASVSDGVRTVSFVHTGTLLTSVVDAAGGTTRYTYDARGRMTGETRPAGNTPFTRTYSSRGRVVSETDASGLRSTFEYDGDAGTTTVTDPLGGETVHGHGADGALVSAEDPSGAAVAVASDAEGRRASVTDPLGAATATAYDAASGKVASLSSAGGSVTTFTWSPRTHASGVVLHDLAGISFPDGTAEAFVHDASGMLTRRTDRTGGVWTFVHTRASSPPHAVVRMVETNPLGGVTTFDFRPDGTLASVTGAGGAATTYEYDALRRRTAIRHADGATRSFAWDARDRLVSTTLEDGAAFLRTYDANGNLTRALGPGGGMSFSWDAMDRLVGAQPLDALAGPPVPSGNAASAAWDALGRLASLTGPDGVARTFSHDAAGWETGEGAGGGVVWSHTFDAAGRVLTSTDALGATVRSAWDADGRLARRTSPEGRVATYAYDPMGRLARRTSGRTTIDLARDASGLLARIAVGGIASTCERNALGGVTKLTDPGGGEWRVGFDAHGRQTSAADPLGRTTTTGYDLRGRPAGVVEPGGGTRTVTWDAVGNAVRIEHSDGTALDFVHDARGRLTAAPGLAISYEARGRVAASNGLVVRRDAAGRIAGVTLAPGREVTYGYDARGFVARVTDWVGGTTDFARDAAGRLVSVARPNGVTTTYAYDADGLVVGIADARDGQAVASVALTRDEEGRVADATRTGAAGAEPSVAAGTVAETFDAASQAESTAHDGLGRVLADGRRTYVWDGLSRLRRVTEGGAATDFTYDGLGALVSADDGTTARTFVWDYSAVLPSVAAERRGGSDHVYFVRTPDGSLLHTVSATDGARRFHHFDERGNTAFTTDDAGAVAASFAYSAYGEVLAGPAAEAAAEPFLFLGRRGALRIGATGLHCVRARWYDAATGRFLSRDPVRTIGPLTCNPYAYAAGNPVDLSDATGEAPEITETDLAVAGANAYGTAADVAGRRAEDTLLGVRKVLGHTEAGKQVERTLVKVQVLNQGLNRVGEVGFAFSAGQELSSTRAAGERIKADRDAALAATMQRFDARFREARRLLRAKLLTPEAYEKLVLDMNRALLEEIQGISEGSYWEESLAYTEGGLKALGSATPVSGSMWDRCFSWLK